MDFLTALAAANPAHAKPLPDGVYATSIVSASVRPNTNGQPILRLDLNTVSPAEHAGRRQVKNQPLTANAAAYVRALLQTLALDHVATDVRLAAALVNGEELVMREFVGKALTVRRTTRADGELQVDIVLP